MEEEIERLRMMPWKLDPGRMVVKEIVESEQFQKELTRVIMEQLIYGQHLRPFDLSLGGI